MSFSSWLNTDWLINVERQALLIYAEFEYFTGAITIFLRSFSRRSFDFADTYRALFWCRCFD